MEKRVTLTRMGPKRVLAVVEDLFFLVKIQDAAKRMGLELTVANSLEQAQERASSVDLVVVDLNHRSLDALQVVAALKELGSARILGFVSHVQTELRQQASHLGCDVVLPRSAFSANLPKLLRTYCDCESYPVGDLGNASPAHA